MNKKGTVWEVVAHPVFSIVFGIGVVFLAVLGAITHLSDSQLYAVKFHSENVPLLIEAAQSVPRELNFFVRYYLPGMKAEIRPGKVIVDGGAQKEFPFTINPDFRVSSFSYEESPENYGFFSVKRVGSQLSFEDGPSPILQDDVFCPEKRFYQNVDFVPFLLGERLALAGVGGLGEPPYADANIVVGFMRVPVGVRVFVTDETVAAGCHIMKKFIQNDGPSSVNVVPVNTELLSPNDPRNVLKYRKAVVIGYADDIRESLLEDAVIGGLK